MASHQGFTATSESDEAAYSFFCMVDEYPIPFNLASQLMFAKFSHMYLKYPTNTEPFTPSRTSSL